MRIFFFDTFLKGYSLKVSSAPSINHLIKSNLAFSDGALLWSVDFKMKANIAKHINTQLNVVYFSYSAAGHIVCDGLLARWNTYVLVKID